MVTLLSVCRITPQSHTAEGLNNVFKQKQDKNSGNTSNAKGVSTYVSHTF